MLLCYFNWTSVQGEDLGNSSFYRIRKGWKLESISTKERNWEPRWSRISKALWLKQQEQFIDYSEGSIRQPNIETDQWGSKKRVLSWKSSRAVLFVHDPWHAFCSSDIQRLQEVLDSLFYNNCKNTLLFWLYSLKTSRLKKGAFTCDHYREGKLPAWSFHSFEEASHKAG